MKIKSIKAALHRFEIKVPLIRKSMHRHINIPLSAGQNEGHRWRLRELVLPMAGLMNGWRVEFHLDMQAVGEQMFISPPGPENNIVKIPQGPGLGLKPDRAMLRDTLVKG